MLIGPIEIDKEILIYIPIHLSDLTELKMSTSLITSLHVILLSCRKMFVTKSIIYFISWGS